MYIHMKVIDCENQLWFLFEHQGKLLLDCNCNHSAFGYSYMIELNAKELAAYKEGGHVYLSTLAHDIHESAPILEKSNSQYKGRDLSSVYSELSLEAVRAWRQT